MKQEIFERWERRCSEWAQLHVQVDGKQIAQEILADLEKIAAGEGDSLLSLAQASAISGYSTDHLSKLIRAGNIPNSGRKGSPRIKRNDLPVRPNRVASGGSLAYDVRADARLLKVRR